MANIDGLKSHQSVETIQSADILVYKSEWGKKSVSCAYCSENSSSDFPFQLALAEILDSTNCLQILNSEKVLPQK